MTPAQEVRWQMHQKLTTAQGRATYSRRKVIVEPVFGQIKQALGFRRFSLRGLGKVAAEWGLVCLCHNLLKLYRTLGPLRLATRGDAVPSVASLQEVATSRDRQPNGLRLGSSRG